jgi:hypothetical protein
LNRYTAAKGSVAGGTILYISGNNFSPIADEIQIFIGDYPCNIIAQGSNVNIISCTTTPMTNPSKRDKLSITMLTVNLLPAKCTTIYCLFSYAD